MSLNETADNSREREKISPPFTHPFDNPEYLAFIKAEFPDHVDRLKTAARPTISRNPDELEQWEADKITKRKERIPYERDFEYLARLLYEECFSVNQFPDEMFRGVPGLTTGGLVSHFYFNGSLNGHTVESALGLNSKGDTLSEALKSLTDWRERRHLLDVVNACSYPMRFGMPAMRANGPHMLKMLSEPEGVNYPEELDTVGMRLLRLLEVKPELMAKVEDPELKSLGYGTNMADFIHRVWGKFSDSILTHQATFKGSDEPGVKEAVNDLLLFRTHPKTQLLFTYLSPSGYLNEHKKGL